MAITGTDPDIDTDDTIKALAAMDSTPGLVEQTGADAFTKRAIGVAASTSIPTRADADGRYVVGAIDTDTTLAANSDTRVASQKAIKAYADQLIAANDAMVFKGVKDCSADPNYPAADAGWTYKVSVAGKIGGASGRVVEVGDLLMCITDSSTSGDHATVGANWVISQTNIDGAVTGPANATSSRVATFSGASGKIIQDGGFALSDLVQMTGSQTIAGTKTFSTRPVFNGNTPYDSGNLPGTAMTWTVGQAISMAGSHALGLTGAGASSQYLDVTNTGGRIIIGVDKSTGGDYFAGSSGYAAVVSAQANTALILASNSLPRLTISSAGGLRAHTYGAGTLVTDASGNVTASSDERLKTDFLPFTRGLADMQAMDDPVSFKWNEESTMDTKARYFGWTAQGVQRGVPEAVSADPRGFLTLMDRPILATHHNAILELERRLAALEARLSAA